MSVCDPLLLEEQRKTNALLETIGAILLHQCEVQEKKYEMGFSSPLYSILDLRKSLIAASGREPR
jgi:hypothetical protein